MQTTRPRKDSGLQRLEMRAELKRTRNRPCQLSTHKVQNIKWLEYDRATGYYAFASATATVQITEYDSKKREEIGAALSAAYTGYGTTVGGSAGFSALVGTDAAGRDVTRYIATNGATSDPPNDSIEALGDYIFHLSNFTDPKANRHKVILSPYSDCKSYQEALMLVPDGGDFPQVPTVPADIFTLWVEVHFLQDGLTERATPCR